MRRERSMLVSDQVGMEGCHCTWRACHANQEWDVLGKNQGILTVGRQDLGIWRWSHLHVKNSEDHAHGVLPGMERRWRIQTFELENWQELGMFGGWREGRSWEAFREWGLQWRAEWQPWLRLGCRLSGRAVGWCVGYRPAGDANGGAQDVVGNECLVLYRVSQKLHLGSP